MKFLARLSLMGSGLGLILLTATPSFATVVGILNTGGNGTVTVTPTGITFSENDTTTGSTEVGAGSTLTFAGIPGTVTPGQPVDIDGGLAITPTSLLSGISILFPDTPGLSLTLTAFGPGITNTDCAGLLNGQSCSPETPFGISPIILTAVGSGTSALLYVTGIATDGTGTSEVTGNFSANIAGETPEELATSASYTATSSSQLVITAANTVPEPRSISLLALAGILMGIVVTKRRRSVA
jgi:hypothetical protein